jgi:hypothetical protein
MWRRFCRVVVVQPHCDPRRHRNFGTGGPPFNFVAARLKLLLAREQRQNTPTMYA